MTIHPTALITGASGGIGLELARIFAREKYNLVLVARSRDALEKIATELQGQYGIATAVIAKDLSDPAAPEELFRDVQAQKLKIEVLVNNAGYGDFGPFAQADTKKLLDMIQLNVVALTHLTKLFLPEMEARGSGKILNVASTASFQPGPFMAVYYATKAFVLSLTEAVGNEVQSSGVSVTALCPGPTYSGFQKAAAMEESKMLEGMKIMDSTTVAEAGYRALMKGRRIVIPGFRNRLLVFSVRLSPRNVVTNLVRKIQERRVP